MFKVVIVDDEKMIVDGLSILIDWNAEGFEIAGTAQNGVQGAETVRLTNADLCLTDIRMPLLSGIEMIDRIRTFNSECRFLVLSGYRDFEYAKESLNRHACGYILKPVQEEELIRHIRRIRKELEESLRLKSDSRKLCESLPVARERFIRDIVTDKTLDTQAIKDKWRFLESGLSLDGFSVTLFLIPEDMTCCAEDLICQIQKESEKTCPAPFLCRPDCIALMCCGGCNPVQTARAVQESVKKNLGINVHAACGGIYYLPNRPYISYQEAEDALQYSSDYCISHPVAYCDIPAKAKGTLAKVQAYILENYSRDISLDMLSRQFNINSSYLSQLFRKQLDCSFIDFLAKTRIDKARALIEDPDVLVYEVGRMVGYNSPRNFSHVFEKIVGCTPTEYRKKLKK